MGPVNTPAGRATLTRRESVLSLEIGGRVRLRTNMQGRLTRLELTPDRIALLTPASVRVGEWIELPGVAVEDIALLRLQDEDLPAHALGEYGVRIDIPAGVKNKAQLWCCLKPA